MVPFKVGNGWHLSFSDFPMAIGHSKRWTYWHCEARLAEVIDLVQVTDWVEIAKLTEVTESTKILTEFAKVAKVSKLSVVAGLAKT